MTKVHKNQFGEKIATFKNVDNGETLEKSFMSTCITAASKAFPELVESGIVDDSGMVDVNPYTLQHDRFENIFAFGDCIKGNITRTQVAAHSQCPVVKHNVKRFMEGKDLNGIYDGYTYMPFYMSHSHATCFQHLWDYEAAPKNHWVPSYGLFARRYFGFQMKSNLKQGEVYTSFKKTHGPPHNHFNPRYDELEHNEYLMHKNVSADSLRAIHKTNIQIA